MAANPRINRIEASYGFVWDVGTLAWIPAEPGGGGGGGGGACTIANGADVTQGNTADAAITTDTTGTVSGKLRGLVAILSNVWDNVNGRLNVSVLNSVAVTGTFWQVTQPVSIASMPATPVTDNGGSLTVDAPVATPVFVRLSDGASAITTLPISAASLPLPANAAQEAGGNLASVKTNTDKIPSQGQALMAASTPVVIASDQTAIPVTGSFSASTAADVLLADDDAAYVDGDTGKNLTQTPDGRLRTIISAKVSDSRDNYEEDQYRSLSLTTDGRLRVATSESYITLEQFVPFNFGNGNPWDSAIQSPWN